jgi:YfiH family protein
MTDRKATLGSFVAEHGWIVPRWDAPAGVHGFVTTRRGGVSAGPFASMNLGFAGDTRDAVLENRRRLAALLPSPPVWLAQAHGTRAVTLDDAAIETARETPPAGDAAITSVRGVPLAILVADCLPVFFADRAGGAIAVAHAGWRGLATGVIEATLAAMGPAPSEIVAWIGPAIGARAFEVGRDVFDAFVATDTGAATHFAPIADHKWLADLRALARRRLTRSGVTSIFRDAACTFSEPERFYSYRRERTTGRMAALLWLDAGAAAA